MKVSDMPYKVVFNNHVGNVGANSLEEAVRMARNVVEYKLADYANIACKINGRFKNVQFVHRMQSR